MKTQTASEGTYSTLVCINSTFLAIPLLYNVGLKRKLELKGKLNKVK
jgi:hypothetical protein